MLVDIEQGIPVGLIEKRTEEEVNNYLKSWEEKVVNKNTKLIPILKSNWRLGRLGFTVVLPNKSL